MDSYKVFVTKIFEFEAAHHLPGYEGDCANVHGHTYKVEVTLSGKILTHPRTISDSMVIDFKDINRAVNKYLSDALDHKDLNNVLFHPTAECLAVLCYYALEYVFPADVKLKSVRVWETSTSYAEYRGE